jgi:primosomal protein N' (replication factor Y)
MDRDTTRRKQSHDKMLDQMEQREADILIGTQMITKGLDFPHITLVGIVLADTGFHIPDFRSAERSFQLLTQVSGRAGRGSQPGEVILQTYNPSHPAIRFASHHDYEGFAQMELASREGLGFPPYQRLARLLVMSSQMDRVEVAAQDFARGLKSCGSSGEELLGPAPAPLFKIRGWYRWQIVLKYASPAKARKMIQKGMEGFFKEKSSRGIRIDAQNLL